MPATSAEAIARKRARNREYQRELRHGEQRERTLAKQRERTARYRAAHPEKARLTSQCLYEPRTLAAKAASLRWNGIAEEGERIGERMREHEAWEFAILLEVGRERDRRAGGASGGTV